MGKYVLLSDIHATERPPSSCTDIYLTDVIGLLLQAGQLANQLKADAVVWAGDVFHHKAPSRTSHKLVQVMINVIHAHSVPVLIVPGNHDMQNDRVESISRTQPLGVLFEAGAHRLEGWAGPNTFAHPLYGVPWQQDWDMLECALDDYRDKTQPSLVVAHAPLYPPGKELEWEHYPAAQWATAMGNRGFCFYGHVHEPHGVYEVDGVTFCNNGALSRGSLHEYNLERQVGVTVWDSETGQFTFEPLDARPASEVFRLAEAEETRTSQVALEKFLEDVGSTQLEVLNVESVLAHIRSLGLGARVEDLAEELLAEAAHGRKT